jgi:hypothetical protein
VTRRRSIAGALGTVFVLLLVAPGVVLAQASPSPAVGVYCVLTPEEVAEFTGSSDTFAVAPREEWCRYEAGYTSLNLRRVHNDLDMAEVLYPDDGRDVEVAGFPAWFGTSRQWAALTVDTGDNVILVELVPGTDLEPTIERVQPIAEVAIPRLVAALGAGATTAPLTDAEIARDELVALFPAELGGERLDVTGQTGAEFLLQIPRDQHPRVEEALATQGRTLDDLAAASAALDGGGNLSALRVRGAAASDMVDPLLRAIFPVEFTLTPNTVSGRSVQTMSLGTANPVHFYPSGDIVWVLAMEETLATEALGMLP